MSCATCRDTGLVPVPGDSRSTNCLACSLSDRSVSGRVLVLDHLTEHGPATIAEMIGVDWELRPRVRQALYLLERDGEVVRVRQTSATDVRGRPCGGPRPWVYALASDEEHHGQA